MRELNVQEIAFVSGAGFIQDGLANLGGILGNLGYTAISSSLNVNIPFLGSVNLGKLFPDLGKEIGASIGSQVGGQIESKLTSLPVIGGLFGKILG